MMIVRGPLVEALVALLVLVGFNSNQHSGAQADNSVRLLDDGVELDLEALARAVCQSTDGHKGQLSRLSSVRKLVDFFESSVGAGHELFACKQLHGEALEMLNEVLTTRQENVCSDDKLALIEDYHNQFVSTQLEHVETRQRRNKATPLHLLNVFFMHYAMEVDALCKRTLINNLDWDLKDKFGDDINERLFMIDTQITGEERKSFGSVFNGVMGKFTDLYAIQKFDDALLVWDILKGSVLSQFKEQEIRDEMDEATGEPIRLVVKVKSAKYLNRIKQHCHYKMKPIYEKLIIPIIKLSDLGYSNTGEQFKIELDELRSNENVKRWYATTQICEALLPVMFHEDPALASEEVVVIGKEEAAELPRKSTDGSDLEQGEPKVRLEYEPQTNSMVGIDKLESVELSEAQKMVRKVKSNVGTRDRAINRAVVHLMRNLKHQLKESHVGKFFFSKKTSEFTNPKGIEKKDHFNKQEVGSEFVQSLDQISERDLLKIDGACGRRLSKSREGAQGIGKRRRHRRKNDVDMIKVMRAEAISYERTKTWSEIFSGWGAILATLAPNRMQLIVAGSLIIGLLLVVLMASLMTPLTAG